jgi:hypothetical protein
MNWYKIEVTDVGGRTYHWIGTSPDSVETLAEKASRGEYLRLDDLLYQDNKGEVKDWAQWDNRQAPLLYINPAKVVTIHPFKADPRTLSK